MKEEKQYIMWLFVVFLVWGGISTYWYTTQIKGFDQEEIFGINFETEDKDNQQNEKDFEEKYYESDDDFFENDKIIKNKTVKTKIVKVVKKTNTKRTIQCFTHLNSVIKINSIKNINTEVKKLEEFFNNYYNSKLIVDGIYSEIDRKEVVKFQAEKKLVADGIVGQKTLRIMNAIYCVKNENK